MDLDMYTNAQLIRKLREDRAWSQEHLAAVAGLSARTIQRVEAESSASRETRMAIAAALGVELAQLNRANGDEVAALPEAAVVASQATSNGPGIVERTVWRLAFLTLALLAFGYVLGKDRAIADGRADCAAKSEKCAGPTAR